MKKFQLEVWNTFDKLCLMSAVTKLKTSFTDQNWVAISRYTKQLHETISTFIQYDSRSDEWFSAKQCSAQYELLIKGSGARKKKKIDRNIDYSDVHDTLLASLTQEFCDELEESLDDARAGYLSSKQVVEDLDTDCIDDEKLDQLIKDMLEVEKVGPDIKTKLKSMLDEKSANETESTTKYASQNLLSTEPSTSSEHKTTNITTSPLLTSLLQSPSPLVRPSPSTSSPTISLLLHSSPSVSLTDPTLSKLLESPTSLPGSSTITSIESSSYIFQGNMVDSKQSSSETKKKQSDLGEEIPVQRVINDPEEFQRTEGFDDMSDIEQGVVESEVIIENESSPVKRLTPRRLDLENIEEEETEEEIVETVEEIMERVEEAIIETVGENNINELVLNETADTVSISDEEMENINIEDNTYEVIVVGTQEEAVPSSNELSDHTVIIDGSNTKLSKIKDVETNDAAKKSEMSPIDDQMRNEDASTESINHQNVDAVCNEVSLIKSSKHNDENSIDYNKERSESKINKVSEESSDSVIISEEKSVSPTVIPVNENSLEKQPEDDKSCDMDSGQTAQVKSLTDDSNVNNTKPFDHLISSTSDSKKHSIAENLDEAVSKEKTDEINHCPQNLPDSNLVNVVTVKHVISSDNKDNESAEKGLGEETELVVNKNEVKSSDKIDRVPAIEIQINKIDDPKINGDYAINHPKSVLEDKVVEEQLELNNEEALKEGENTEGVSRNSEVICIDSEQPNNEEMLRDGQNTEGVSKNSEIIFIDSQQSNNEEASKSEDIISIDSQQSNNEELLRDGQNTEGVSRNGEIIYLDSQQSNAAVSISSDEIVVMSISSDEIESPEKVNHRQRRTQPENDKLIGTPESMDHVVIIDSDSGSCDEFVINSNEIGGTMPMSNSNLPEEPKQDNGKNKEKNITSEQTELDIEHSENEQEEANTDEFENINQNPKIIEEENRLKSKDIEKNICSIGIMEENREVRETHEVQETHLAQETHGPQETPEAVETSKAHETREAQEAHEAQETHETHRPQETHEPQESHDGSYDGISGPIYIESDESKSDSTEETEDNSILTTEDSKDGLDDSLKFSSLETLSMPSVDSPPEYNDPRFAGLTSKEKEFRSLIGKGFEELKSKAAELVYIPDNVYEEKSLSGKQGKTRSKSRTKKDKSFKSKKMTEKANRGKSNDSKQLKEKSSKERVGKDKLSTEKPSSSGRKSKCLNSFDSKPGSPSLSTASSDEDRDYKSWKKSILLVYNRLASHKYASVFSKPITENEAPSYHQLILRPMDLSTIKRNIENGVIRTTVEFQRDMLLMVQNAIMYNKYDTPVYDMAKAMGEDMLAQMEVMVQALGDGVPLIGDTTEEKQITRARTSKSSAETPQNKKRKTQEPDEIRPKRSKPSTSC